MDDEAKKCEGCGKTYYPAGRWIHERRGCFRQGASESSGSLVGGIDSIPANDQPGIVDTQVSEQVEAGVSVDKTETQIRWDSKQRRDKDKYNAYMRANRHRWKK